jgi:hypothetical protein
MAVFVQYSHVKKIKDNPYRITWRINKLPENIRADESDDEWKP